MITLTDTQLRMEFPPVDLISTIVQVFGARAASSSGGIQFSVDRTTGRMSYHRPHLITQDETLDVPITDVKSIRISGNINYASVWMVLQNGDDFILRVLPRTEEGRSEMHQTLDALKRFFSVPLEIPEFINEWWQLQPPST